MIILSILTIIIAIAELSVMSAPGFPVIALLSGVIALIGSIPKKKAVNFTTTIIAFLLFFLSHGFLLLMGLSQGGSDDSFYFYLTLGFCIIPAILYICMLVCASKRSKKNSAKKKNTENSMENIATF